MNTRKFLIVLLVVLAIVILGCGAKGDAALKVTGSVAKEKGWTEDQVKQMKTMDAESTNKSGETEVYTGVSIMDVLNKAGLNDDATSVVFVADDGSTAEIALDDLRSCPDCILSFRTNGGFSSILPGYDGKLQVKGVVEIQVK